MVDKADHYGILIGVEPGKADTTPGVSIMPADFNTVEFWPVGMRVLVNNHNGRELWGTVDTARFPKSNPTNVLVVLKREDEDGYASFYPAKCEGSWVCEPATV